jgi:hypothetical protein
MSAMSAVRLHGAVAFVEQEVEHVQDAAHALRLDALHLHVLAEPRARPLQSLVDGVIGLKQPKRDLLDAETAERLQREDEL